LEQQSSRILLKDQADYLLELFNQVLLSVLFKFQFCGARESQKVGWRVFRHKHICSDTSFRVWIGCLCGICAFPKRSKTTRHNTLKTEDRKPLLKLRHNNSLESFVWSRFLYLANVYSDPSNYLLQQQHPVAVVPGYSSAQLRLFTNGETLPRPWERCAWSRQLLLPFTSDCYANYLLVLEHGRCY
jgi:hypothetical protein